MSDSANPSSSSRYFKLGLFMLIGAGLLVAGVIALGAGALFRKTIPAETLVYESVNGLEVGSAVKYRGVPVGKVTQILFSSAKYPQAELNADQSSGDRSVRGILIEMSIDEQAFPGKTREQIIEESKKVVEQGLRARVTPAGISGQSYVECDLLNPADHPPPPISWTPDELYIPSAPSTVGQVLDAASQIAGELQKANLGKVISHFDDLVTQATAAVTQVKQVVSTNKVNLDRTLSELPDTAAKLRATVARADEILHDPRVNKALNGVSGLGDSATATLTDVRRLAHELSELVEGESGDLRSIITDLRRIAADGASLVDDAKANPSRLFFGKPPPHDTPK